MEHYEVISHSIKKAFHLCNICKRRKTLTSYAVPLLFYEKIIPSPDTERMHVLISFLCNGRTRLLLLSFQKISARCSKVSSIFPFRCLSAPTALCAPVHIYYSFSLHLSAFVCICLYLYTSLIRFQFNTST